VERNLQRYIRHCHWNKSRFFFWDRTEGMEGFTVSFSESITASSKVVLSPNGLFLAYNIHNQEKLLIRDVHGGYKVSARFNTVFGSFNQIEWSSDSLYISVSSIGQALIQVFSTAERRWNCKIDIGSQDLGGVGLFDFSWSPNSRHLLTTASEHVNKNMTMQQPF